MDVFCFFFFKQKTAYEMRISDWSSDVCSSDLVSTIVQTGSGHYAGAGQYGDNDTSSITQAGSAQYALVLQYGDGNSSLVDQSGNNNSATVQQFTNGKGSFVTPSGSFHTARVAPSPLDDPGAFTPAPRPPLRGSAPHEEVMPSLRKGT